MGRFIGNLKQRIRSRYAFYLSYSEKHGPSEKKENKYHQKMAKGVSFLAWNLFHPKYWFFHGVFFPFVEMPLTTNCSLRCKECANFMQYYDKKPFVPSEILIADIEKLLGCVDKIYIFRLLGGEPFVYPDLAVILKYLLSCDKIARIEIATNGTIFPDEELQGILKNERIRVWLSDYGEHSRKKAEWLTIPDIHLTVADAEEYWCSYGKPIKGGKSLKELKRQYSKCGSGNFFRNYSYFNGNLYACPRSAHGNDLGFFKDRPEEYAVIRDVETEAQGRENLKRIQKLKYVTACDYCNCGTAAFVPVKAAEQSKEKMSL